jgi:integrase/recombinase XerD
MKREIAEYQEHLKALNQSSSQIEGMRYAGEKLIAYLKSEHQVSSWIEATPEQLMGFSSWLQAEYRERHGQEMSGHSLVRWVSCMRCFFAWLQRSRRLLRNPAAEIELPKTYHKQINVLSEGEIARLIEMPNISTRVGLRDRALMEMLYATGARVSEARNLDLYDLSFDEKEIRIRQGKGNKGRVVPLTEQACYWLETYINEARPLLATGKYSVRKRVPCTALLLSQMGSRITRDGIEKRISEYAASAGLPATPHTFRHAFATHLLRGGAKIEAIKLLLGHEDIYTTQIYTQVEVSDLQQIIKDDEARW